MSTLWQGRPAAQANDGLRAYLPSASFSLTTSSLYIGDGGKHYGSFARFLNVTVPAGKVIDTAFIKTRCRNSGSGATCKTRIRAQKATDPAIFSDTTDFDARVWTDEFVRWDPVPAMTAGAYYDTPDFAAVIQEIIGQPGWASGQAMVVVIEDWEQLSGESTSRETYSWDGSRTTCWQLNITYSDPPPASGGGPANLVAMGQI